MPTDKDRLDWIACRRVVVMRCRAPVHNDAWKVETMRGPFIRADLRAAIDAAMEKSEQPASYDGDGNPL